MVLFPERIHDYEVERAFNSLDFDYEDTGTCVEYPRDLEFIDDNDILGEMDLYLRNDDMIHYHEVKLTCRKIGKGAEQLERAENYFAEQGIGFIGTGHVIDPHYHKFISDLEESGREVLSLHGIERLLEPVSDFLTPRDLIRGGVIADLRSLDTVDRVVSSEKYGEWDTDLLRRYNFVDSQGYRTDLEAVDILETGEHAVSQGVFALTPKAKLFSQDAQVSLWHNE